MQNIRVKRYKHPNGFWTGWVEPEDSSWVLFIDIEGAPLLMRRTEHKTDVENCGEYSHYVADKPTT